MSSKFTPSADRTIRANQTSGSSNSIPDRIVLNNKAVNGLYLAVCTVMNQVEQDDVVYSNKNRP
jgi:hypothetical protein